MKKLIYISYVDFASEVNAGVKNKIESQVKVFRNHFITDLFTIYDDKIYCEYNNHETKTKNFRGGVKRIEVVNFIKASINRNIPDIVYLRYQFSDPHISRLFKYLKKLNVKIVVEIPTYPYYRELKLQGILGFAKALYDYWYHFSLFKSVNRIVTYSKHDNIYNVETIKLINGIDFSLIPLCDRTSSDNIRLIAVSSLKPWHGYDRLINGMKDYYRENPNGIVKLIIVGAGVEYDKYHRMISEYSLEEHIKLIGAKKGPELNEIFNQSDIAVSSLALHRLNLTSASTLKSREYAARGMPIIVASKEDITMDSKYILEFDANESNIDIEKIVKFYNIIFNDNKINSKKIRESVIKTCDINNAFFPVIEYMREGVNND
jgi:hypothetical protein